MNNFKILRDFILAFTWRNLQKPQETAGRTVGVSDKLRKGTSPDKKSAALSTEAMRSVLPFCICN